MIVTSSLCTFSASLMLYRVVRLSYSRAVSLLGLALLLFNPLAIYFFNGYAESLLLLTLCGVLFCIEFKKSFFLAAIFATVSPVVKPHGVIICALFCFMLVWHQLEGSFYNLRARWKFAAAALFLYVPVLALGLTIYTVCCWYYFDDSLIYKNAITAWYTQGFIHYPWKWPSSLFTLATDLAKPPAYIASHIASCQLFVILALLITMWRKLPVWIVFYSASLVCYVYLLFGGAGHLGRPLVTAIVLPFGLAILVEQIKKRAGAPAAYLVAASLVMLFAYEFARLVRAYHLFIWVS
jgi:hypothetical protein